MTLPHTRRTPPSTGLSRPEMTTRYERDRLGFLTAVTREHGTVVEMAPGTFLVSDPACVHDVFRRTNKGFLLSENTMREAVPSHAGDPELDTWMAGRRGVQSAMTPAALADHARGVAADVAALADRWTSRRTVVQPVAELEDLMARWFVRFCFGGREAAGVARHVRHFLATLLPIIASPLQIPPGLRRLMPRYIRAERAQTRLAAAMRQVLANPGAGGIADAMVAAGVGSRPVPADRIVTTLIPVSVAACGVPAAAVTWALVELARHPDIADDVAAHRDADQPPLVRWVIDESLRLWPPTWLAFRSTAEDQQLGDWTIPAGSAVMISPYVVHRTAACFPQPDTFQPLRWRDLTPPHGAYIPFGAGPRWCVGARLARTELETTITTLTTRLRLTLPNGPPRPDARRTLTPANLTFHATAR